MNTTDTLKTRAALATATAAEHIVDEVLQGWSMRGWGEVATNWL